MNVLKHLFNFDRMITPVLIRTTFIFAVALEVLIGLIIMVTAVAFNALGESLRAALDPTTLRR